MRLRLAARHSDLAQIQAKSVGEALVQAHPGLKVEYAFRSTVGDQNLEQPLWQSEQKGLFTQDFREDLLKGQIDLVVHSWKDLPVDLGEETVIAATMHREDPRDILLLKKTVDLNHWPETVSILTSSPRRMYNLAQFLPSLLPGLKGEINFEIVRGNVPTRIRKLMSGTAQGLIVAKAAMDRLLMNEEASYAEGRKTLRGALSECRFMILPLSVNPTAAAQGALAIETLGSRDEIRELLQPIHHTPTYECVQKERKILQSYGGGCHQKIGVTVLQRPFGEITYLNGLTDSGKKLNSVSLHGGLNGRWPEAKSKQDIFSTNFSADVLYNREPLGLDMIPEGVDFWISRSEAWPKVWEAPTDSSFVWTSGLKSWQKLAAKGIWVNGCADGLGENEEENLECLVGRKLNWVKLTHADADTSTQKHVICTYRLKPTAVVPNVEGKTHFYWSSFSSFMRVVSLAPSIVNGYHGCGPGHTYELLRQKIPAERLGVFLSHEDWKRQVLPNSAEV